MIASAITAILIRKWLVKGAVSRFTGLSLPAFFMGIDGLLHQYGIGHVEGWWIPILGFGWGLAALWKDLVFLCKGLYAIAWLRWHKEKEPHSD